MQVSSKLLPSTQVEELHRHLALALVAQRSASDMSEVLKDFLTDTERQVLAKRLAIAVMLQEGKSYQEVKKHLQVSTATISFVAEHLQERGIQHLIGKVAADKWAIGILSGWFSKVTPPANIQPTRPAAPAFDRQK